MIRDFFKKILKRLKKEKPAPSVEPKLRLASGHSKTRDNAVEPRAETRGMDAVSHPPSSRQSVPSVKQGRSKPPQPQDHQEIYTSPPASITRQDKRKTIHVQVGLDFGTSSTKVMFSYIGGRVVRPVLFDTSKTLYPPYALPSLAAVDGHGQFCFGALAARELEDKLWDQGLRRFKMLVAGQYDQRFADPKTLNEFRHYLDEKGLAEKIYTPELITIAYLALVMQEAERSIRALPEFKGEVLDLAFNICMPIDYLQNNAVLPAYEKLILQVEHAYNLLCHKPRMEPIDAALETTGNTFPEIPKPERRVFLVPEAVAQIASYLLSVRRHPGIHAVLDFGQGTTDVCIFNLLSPSQADALKKGELSPSEISTASWDHVEEDLIPRWYSGVNLPWGTIKVERTLAAHQPDHGRSPSAKKIIELLEQLDGKGGPPDLRRAVYEELLNFKNSDQYCQAWNDGYKRLKQDRYWTHVQVFLCGGGAGLPTTNEVFSVPWWDHLKSNFKAQYEVQTLPIPDDYDTRQSHVPFNRMAVAYGLSVPFPQLEDYCQYLPKDCPEDTPLPPPVLNRDRDEMYPK